MNWTEEKLHRELTKLEDTLQRVISERDAAWRAVAAVRRDFLVPIRCLARTGRPTYKLALEASVLCERVLRGEVVP